MKGPAIAPGAQNRAGPSTGPPAAELHRTSPSSARGPKRSQILPARQTTEQLKLDSKRIFGHTQDGALSFSQVFGVLGIPLLVTLMVCLAWTSWLIVLALTPTKAANLLMGTSSYDNGGFWLFNDANPGIVLAGAVGLVIVDSCYLLVTLRMLFWRDKLFGAAYRSQPTACVKGPYSQLTRSPIYKRLRVLWGDFTAFEGRNRKKWVRAPTQPPWPTISSPHCQFVEYAECAPQARRFGHGSGHAASAATKRKPRQPRVRVCRLLGCERAVVRLERVDGPVFGTDRGGHRFHVRSRCTDEGLDSQPPYLVLSASFDLSAAVLFPVATLVYSYYFFDFDRQVYLTYLEQLPPGSFEHIARSFADPSEIALFRVNFDSLRIDSIPNFVLRISMNLTFCYRFERVLEALVWTRHREVIAQRLRPGTTAPVSQNSVPKGVAALFLAIGLVVLLSTHKAIADSTALCSRHPECVVYAHRWQTSDEHCPCLILIDVDVAPKTYEEWIKPVDGFDKVQALASAGLLTSLQVINRQLVEWPEELRKCRGLKVMYVSWFSRACVASLSYVQYASAVN
jgi:hypothetical protein